MSNIIGNITSLLFDKDECQSLILKYDNNLEHVTQGLDNKSRNVFLKNINPNEIPELIAGLDEANREFYNFQLLPKVECYFGKYPTDCHYSAHHSDCISGENTQRKLSFSLILNADYEGGDFVFEKSVIKKEGTLIVFPSFLPHHVTPVTLGVRYAIFGFWRGPHWS
jgi:PKHD-type hydroxylase